VRATVIKDGDERPGSEVDRRPDQEERHVEEGRLPPKQRILCDRLGVRPLVEIVQAEEQGEEKGRHHRDRGEDRLPDAAHDDPPGALGGVLDQYEEQPAEGQAQEEHERHEPREEELLRVRRSEDRADRRAQ
jgi:hypothetical protein